MVIDVVLLVVLAVFIAGAFRVVLSTPTTPAEEVSEAERDRAHRALNPRRPLVFAGFGFFMAAICGWAGLWGTTAAMLVLALLLVGIAVWMRHHRARLPR